MSPGGDTVVLLVAAGSGSRAGAATPKQYAPIAGKPLIVHALERLGTAGIENVLVVIGEGQRPLLERALNGRPLPPTAQGGETRQISVRNGLEAIASAGSPARVLIHDAARPFLEPEVVARLLGALDAEEAAVPALPVADTLARSDGTLGETVAREGLVRVQTPQAFRFETILAAHRQWSGPPTATDDAQVVRSAGIRVVTVRGDERLEKITLPGDFERAERMIESSLVTCTGMGFDVHRFEAGDRLWLGGIEIAHSRGLKGHSDADVVLHAITDALLGAAALGDLGDHFPPSDPQWKGAASALFLEHALRLIEERNGRIVHVDATVICETPKVGPFRASIRENIAHLLRLPLGRVSVKATTTERLGFTGRGEGIAAQAIATVRLPEAR